MSALKQYGEAVLSGKIVACDKIKRVCEMLLEQITSPSEYHFDEDIAKKHIEFIERFCRQPSGELGKSLKLQLFQKARLEAVFGMVDDNDLRQFNECLIIEGRKNGKALALGTEIPTPSGFKKIEEISEGDYVYGQDGKPHAVRTISEVFVGHDCYEVTIRGLGTLIADADHIWCVRDRKGRVVDKTTTELLHYSRTRKDGKGTEYLYRVPITRPVEYESKDLPIDPYTFGVWLGDGSSSDTRITVANADLAEMYSLLETQGHSVRVYYNKDRAPALGLDIVKKGYKNKLLLALRELGVENNKHIPDIYLTASVEQRMELLRGLMDTDGHCEKHGQCEFAQKNEVLVDNVRELLASLGFPSSKRRKTIICNGKECHAYSVLFFTDKTRSCFKIQRKHARLKEQLAERMKWASIVLIKPVKSVPCKCIAIDSDDHLYLAGRGYITTHNTTECAAVELDMLMNDGEGAPQIYNVATMLDQAKLGFNAANNMRLQSPALKKYVRKRTSDLYFEPNLGFIKALASNSNSLDGLNVHCGVIDELSAIKNRDIYDLVKQGMGARRQPLLFCITTNGFIRGGIFDAQYAYAKSVLEGQIDNKRFLPFIYELDSPDEWDKPEMWIKANPGLGTIKSMDYLAEMVQKAKDDPSFKPTVMVKDFNIPQTSESAWLRFEDLNNEQTFADALGEYAWDYCIGGFDAADSIDLNAAVAVFQRPNDENVYVRSMFWIPQEVIDQQNAKGDRRERDAVPYSLWIEQGYMRTCAGNKCDKRIFLEWFKELRDEQDIYTLFIGYDPWHISDELLREFKAEFGESSMIPIRQGVITLSEPMKSLAADFKAHKIIYDNNPVLKWCLINTEAKTDVNGNIQPSKGLNPNKRIDGTAALLDAYVVLQNKKDYFINLNKEANE